MISKCICKQFQHVGISLFNVLDIDFTKRKYAPERALSFRAMDGAPSTTLWNFCCVKVLMRDWVTKWHYAHKKAPCVQILFNCDATGARYSQRLVAKNDSDAFSQFGTSKEQNSRPSKVAKFILSTRGWQREVTSFWSESVSPNVKFKSVGDLHRSEFASVLPGDAQPIPSDALSWFRIWMNRKSW